MPDIQDKVGFPAESTSAGETSAYDNSRGRNVSAPGSTHTKGSWTELLSSTGKKATMITVGIINASGGRFMMDIGTGPNGSEVVLIPNLFGTLTSSASVTSTIIPIPIVIPAGTRIAARVQSSLAGYIYNAWLWLTEID